MIDFTPIQEEQLKLHEFARAFTVEDLRRETNEMIDTMLALIAGATDADVTFVPDDPEADDPYALAADEVNLPWTLGHVVVHTTASAEESAFLAAELARGVQFHGRSRYETPWRTVTTIAHCRWRLEESRRIRLASLALWPDPPHLDNSYTPFPAAGRVGPRARFLLGLLHDADHLGQLEEIARQAKAGRLDP